MKNLGNFIFLLILILILLIIIFQDEEEEYYENFENNQRKLYCMNDPLNSNCICSEDKPVQTIVGRFPYNYGTNAPYIYQCVPKSTSEPPVNLWNIPGDDL